MTDGTQPWESKSYRELLEAGDWGSISVRDEPRFRRMAHRASLRFPALQESDCQDIVQNTWIAIYQKRNSFDPSKGPYEAWSYQICISKIYDTLRELRRTGKLRDWQPDLSDETPEEWLDRVSRAPENFDTPESLLICQERRQVLEDLLARLDPEKRDILVLKHCEELSVEAIAELYGVNPAAMKKRIYRATQELHKLLTEPCVEAIERATAR